MTKIVCNYGNNNQFNIFVSDSIEYGQLYQIIARILDIKDTDIKYIVSDGILINSKYLRFDTKINIYTEVINLWVIIELGNDLVSDYLNYTKGDKPQIQKENKNRYYGTIISAIDLPQENKSEHCFCGEHLNDGYSTVLITICNHLFHTNCITTYLKGNKKTCPICVEELYHD